LTEGEAEDRTDGGQVTAAENYQTAPNGESEGAIEVEKTIEADSFEHGDESNDASLVEWSEKVIIAELERNDSVAEASTLNSGIADGEAASIDAKSLISDPNAVGSARPVVTAIAGNEAVYNGD
jgi:hypothetical protein